MINRPTSEATVQKARAVWLLNGGNWNKTEADTGHTRKTLKRWAKTGNWKADLERIREKATEKIVKSVADRVADNLRIVDAVKVKLVSAVNASPAVVSLSDGIERLVNLIKVEQLLTGKPTERHDLKGDAFERAVHSAEQLGADRARGLLHRLESRAGKNGRGRFRRISGP